MALYIPHSIFHFARLLYVRPETFGPYYAYGRIFKNYFLTILEKSFAFMLIYWSYSLFLWSSY